MHTTHTRSGIIICVGNSEYCVGRSRKEKNEKVDNTTDTKNMQLFTCAERGRKKYILCFVYAFCICIFRHKKENENSNSTWWMLSYNMITCVHTNNSRSQHMRRYASCQITSIQFNTLRIKITLETMRANCQTMECRQRKYTVTVYNSTGIW